MIDNESEPGSWKDALFWRQQLDHALWRGPKVGASKEKEYIDINETTFANKPSIDNILKERGSRYGDFGSHAIITQTIKEAMRHSPNWAKLPNDMKEALEMVAHKVGRILNGDFTYTDNVVDIIGYMQLVLDRMERTNADAKDKVE